MERIQDNVTFGLLNHAALDYAVDRILGLPVEFGKVVYRPVHFHVLHQHLLCILDFFRGAEVVVYFVFVEAEDFR